MKSYQVFTNDRRVYNVTAESSQEAVYKAIPTINVLTPTKDKYLANIRTYLVGGNKKSERFYIATYGAKDFVYPTPQEINKLLVHIGLVGGSSEELVKYLTDKGYSKNPTDVPSLKIYKAFKNDVPDIVFLKNAPHDYVVIIPNGVTTFSDFRSFGAWEGHWGYQCDKIACDYHFWSGPHATRITFVGGHDLIDTEYLCSCSANVIDISNLDTSKVRSMSAMFQDCDVTHDIVGIEDLNIQNVTNMSAMFRSARLFSVSRKVLNLNNWDFSSVKNTRYMFVHTELYGKVITINSKILKEITVV